MPLADFIHLRVHSAYSLSAGAIKIKELVGLCKANAMPAVAITDSGNLFGALEFSVGCANEGVQPIIGCELGLRPRETDRAAFGRAHAASEPQPILLLVQNEAGYANLMKLVSKSYMET